MKYQEIESASKDLRYIRDVLGRHDDDPMLLHSKIIWSSYALIGFTLLDFYPKWGGDFLLLGVIIGTLLEFVFAALSNKPSREKNKDMALRSLSHLFAFNLTGAVIVTLAFCGIFTNGYSMGQTLLVLTGYHFITSGLLYPAKFHLKWNGPVLLGLLLLTAAVLVSFVDHGVWTGVGVIMALVFGMGFQLRKPPASPSLAEAQ